MGSKTKVRHQGSVGMNGYDAVEKNERGKLTWLYQLSCPAVTLVPPKSMKNDCVKPGRAMLGVDVLELPVPLLLAAFVPSAPGLLFLPASESLAASTIFCATLSLIMSNPQEGTLAEM